jgi:hypothetical protein
MINVSLLFHMPSLVGDHRLFGALSMGNKHRQIIPPFYALLQVTNVSHNEELDK